MAVSARQFKRCYGYSNRNPCATRSWSAAALMKGDWRVVSQDGTGEHDPTPASSALTPPVPLDGARSPGALPSTHERLVRIPAGRVALEGALTIPRTPDGLVVVACASGTSRCARLKHLARGLQAFNLATLVVDLLIATEKEAALASLNPPDAFALGERLVDLTASMQRAPTVHSLPIAYVGIHSAAGAALAAAAAVPDGVAAVVCLGCSADSAQFMLADVRAPTLLLVGERDTEALEAAERALSSMTNTRNLTVMPGVSHRLEQPGALERVVSLAGDWLQQYLRRAGRIDGRAAHSRERP